jgi:hypothetical protein
VEFWLESIQAHIKENKSAPVILVGTHLDCLSNADKPDNSLVHKYQTMFPTLHIHCFIAVSCTKLINITQLVHEITVLSMKQPHMPELFSGAFIRLEKQLRLLKERYQVVTKQHLTDVATNAELTYGEIPSAFLLLHHLGLIVYFPDLPDVICLNPQWLTKLMATVITATKETTKHGVISLTQLSTLWEAAKYPKNIHGTLLELFKKFELMYAVNSERFLFPALLPVQLQNIVLDKHWPNTPLAGQAQLIRLYKFKFVPSGFFPVLMVSKNVF